VVTRECYLSCMILRGSDNSRFYQVKTDLQNDMTKGTDNFSKTVVQTIRLLSNYKVPPRHVCAQEPDSKGVVFVQGAGEKTPVIGTIDCWHCGKKGHYKTSCPKLQIDEGVQNLSIKDSVQEHSLFLTDDDYEMLQKEETGVRRWANGGPQNSSGPFGYLATPPMSTTTVKPQGQKGTTCTSTRAQLTPAPPILIS
jgi:hypothetical protein